MKALINLLNALPTDHQIDLAGRCQTSIGYLRKACSTGQLLGPALCVAIERETSGKVTRKDLRPGDWDMYWPELVAQEAA